MTSLRIPTKIFNIYGQLRFWLCLVIHAHHRATKFLSPATRGPLDFALRGKFVIFCVRISNHFQNSWFGYKVHCQRKISHKKNKQSTSLLYYSTIETLKFTFNVEFFISVAWKRFVSVAISNSVPVKAFTPPFQVRELFL